ncbi:tRNA glutamyl-Q(34) synthetase GluQRS [uncultured Tateyamaria sp.]|uniref:tRNA glutamyl-Q(34) synthetase GluQRS n=1 Tax=uncultured Tateyamaria sp. TaxID=455651 RepID=UPI00260EAA84|nr:tRNA glutamyl-Q(34) synthetase GluQRS [uncultured Tateyamaria sp.]
MIFTTRFAPSPTGPLHLGHAYSAILAHDMARARGGRFLLRIEDIDTTRARLQWEHAIYDDLSWLGLTWDAPPIRQSDRIEAYRDALHDLWANRHVLFDCTCSRKDILGALGAPQEGAELPFGPDGLIYPGTCRDDREMHEAFPDKTTLRLDMSKAVQMADGGPFTFQETGTPTDQWATECSVTGHALIRDVGDIVLSRKDFVGSYHLSVVLDDAYQGITHVVRGADLFDSTKIHVLLQRLLGLPTPVYHHHRLIRDDAGKRLAKRDDARAISKYRADGCSPADIRAMVGLPVASDTATSG